MKLQDVMDSPQANSAAQFPGVLRWHLPGVFQVTMRPVSINAVDYNRKHECFCVKWCVEAWYSCGGLSFSPTTESLLLTLELTNWLSSQLQGSTYLHLPRVGPSDLLCYSACKYLCVCFVLSTHFVLSLSHTEYS